MARRKVSKAEARRQREQAVADREAGYGPLPQEFVTWLQNTYTPTGAECVDDATLRQFIEQVLLASPVRGIAALRKYTTDLKNFAVWAHGRQMPLQPVTVTRVNVDEYARVGMTTLDKSRTARRSKLRNLADALHPEQAPPRAESIARDDLKPPYTERQTQTLVRVIRTQPSDALIRKLHACVGLGLGAGIDSPDLKQLHRRDIDDLGGDGIKVTVPGPRARVVWVLREYEEVVRRGLQGLAPGDLVIGRVTTRNNVAAAVYADGVFLGEAFRPEQSRLRTTWLATLMTRPIPLVLICQAAGLKSTRTLFDLLAYLPDVTDIHALRDGGAR